MKGMVFMQHGVIIDKGPNHYQILQQRGGGARLKLSGHFVPHPDTPCNDPCVYARVVREDDSQSLIWWTPANMEPENRWSISLSLQTGGLYRIETCLRHTPQASLEWAQRGDMRHHVGVGDVFVIAGQSNAAGYGKDSIYDPPELGVHLLRNSGCWDIASHPLGDTTNSIHSVNTDIPNTGHSPYLIFAKRLRQQLGYPIGLVQSALGGSSLSYWNPLEDGRLYHSMIATLKTLPGGIAGMLWYQGCSETGSENPASYLPRFQEMVLRFRKDMKKNLPILTVQLNRYTDAAYQNQCGWGIVRDCQRLAAKSMDKVQIVPSYDCTLSDQIHNSSSANMVIGERLAKAALGDIYHKTPPYLAPDIEKAVLVDTCSVRLDFCHVGERLFSFLMPPHKLPFVIESPTGPIPIDAYEDKENTILLHTTQAIPEGSLVHCMPFSQSDSLVPVDTRTNMPVLGFYGMKIQSTAKNDLF